MYIKGRYAAYLNFFASIKTCYCIKIRATRYQQLRFNQSKSIINNGIRAMLKHGFGTLTSSSIFAHIYTFLVVKYIFTIFAYELFKVKMKN